jgi:tetratricopeptide (TPR) repeat protein
MFSFLKRLFRAKPQYAPDDIVEESVEIDFSRRGSLRFREHEEERYSVRLGKGRLELRLDRENLFAWAENPVHRYSDFVAEADLLLDLPDRAEPPAAEGAKSAKAAAGLLFRYSDEEHFYCAMVSDSGYARLDVVFNGVPRPLIAWTEIGSGPSRRAILTVIARGPRICLLVNDQWVAEIDDDSYASGYLAFGAQNYGAGPSVTAAIDGFMLDSRPVEVETAYQRALSPLFLKPRARKALAETFLAMGRPLPAALHLRKMASSCGLGEEERFLLAEANLRAGLLDEARDELERLLQANPGHAGAQAQKADVLYLQGRYLELRDWLESVLPQRGAEAPLWNLLGHARHNLGEFRQAADAYSEAAALDPEQALYALNAARSLDSAGEVAAAVASYLRAANACIAADRLDDLSLIISRLKELAPDEPGLMAIEGKLAYREDRMEEAHRAFEALIRAGSADASVYYLDALILQKRGQAALSVEYLKEACAREAAFPLYRFRLAEALHLSGRDAGAEIGEALALAPEDGWTLNLAGQYATTKGQLALARERLDKAIAALPGEIDPLINLSALLAEEGDFEAAARTVMAFPGSGRARNQAGNVLVAAGKLEEALAEYDAAVRLLPDDDDLRLNRAACLIELDRYSDAESDLRRVLESKQDGRAYLLMGRLADVYGDYPRAEVAFRAALENAPGDRQVTQALADIYLNSRRVKKAEELIGGMEESDHPKAAEYRARLLDLTHDSLSCSGCGRRWSVPKDIPAQGALRVSGELPDHSPAGTCPDCGKTFCVGCRKDDMENGRLVCPDCRAGLKLADGRLKYLVLRSVNGGSPRA